MSIAYLNGQFMPLSEAKISPMDRGFLFGDGIYEVIPSYGGMLVGFGPHLQRMDNGLAAIGIEMPLDQQQWREVLTRLMADNEGDNLGLYLHISRGAEAKRFHGYPETPEPTVFAFAFSIPQAPSNQPEQVKGYRVVSEEDMRWRRCQIKSTSLLGNVIHFQQGREAGADETLLFNRYDELTEASACNVFIVKDGVIATPPLDNQILPGVTRLMVVDMLKNEPDFVLEERVISRQEVEQADEIWLTSSSKEIAPVIELDGNKVGNGEPGPLWQRAISLYGQRKQDY